MTAPEAAAPPAPPPAAAAPAPPRVAVAITASARPDLYRRAVLSLRLRCLDCGTRVAAWFAVDDRSPPAALAAMRAAAPDVHWVSRSPNATGHAASLNALVVAARDYDYVLLLEDDFFFVRDGEYVSRAVAVLQRDASLGQLLFNERYAASDDPATLARVVGGVAVADPATGAPSHIVHEYGGPLDSPAWRAAVARHPAGTLSHAHWPHFSLNPGLLRVAALGAVGPFDEGLGSDFEHAYGARWTAAGYRTAFLHGVAAVHLGRARGARGASVGSTSDADALYARHGLDHSAARAVSAYDLQG